MEIKKILENTSNFVTKRLIELFGILILILSAFLLISLLSYYPEDPNFIFPQNTEINNILGFRGSVISDLFFQSIGLISLLFAITFLITGINIFRSKKLIGTHDFSTFRASNCSAKSPVRTINEIIVSKSKNRIKLKFKSKSFLKNQVRSMVGCLKYLGEKKWNLKKFENIIIKKDRKKVAPPAPAYGLYLEKIIY